jgi:hypothetical protein
VAIAADPAVDPLNDSVCSAADPAVVAVVVIAADPAVNTGSVVAVWLQILQSTGLVVWLAVGGDGCTCGHRRRPCDR